MKTENKEEKITDEEYEQMENEEEESTKEEETSEEENERLNIGWTPFGCLPMRYW
jgi:hypothetical protein